MHYEFTQVQEIKTLGSSQRNFEPAIQKVTFRLDLLDGLRGLAAMLVMLGHYSFVSRRHFLENSWIAVDLFFILSGIVITHAYSGKILHGLKFSSFLLARTKRLGPFYFVGFLLAVVADQIAVKHNAATVSVGAEIWRFVAAGVSLPYFPHYPWPFSQRTFSDPIFQLNLPRWSIFFELVANIIFFWHLRTRKTIPGIKLAGSILLFHWCLVFTFRTINPGPNLDTFFLGFPRVIGEFFLGAAIYKRNFHLYKPRPVITAILILLTFSIMFTSNNILATFDAAIMVPICLISASAVRLTGVFRSICGVLGLLSYPLYITHFPLKDLVLNLTVLDLYPTYLSIGLISTLAIFLSWVLVKFQQCISIHA